MGPEPSAAEQELESLTQFLYIAPIGLVEASRDGEILLINAKSAQLLLPLARDGELSNLFDVFESVAPDLRLRTEAHRQASGLICENVPLRIGGGGGRGRRAPQVLSLTLLKLDETRLMAVVDDISAALRRDEALRRSHSWISSFLAGIDHYALLPLDRQGQVASWNAGVERLTGYDAQRSVGQPHTIFHADAESSQQTLERADREGWSLDDGWHRRADGSRYWGSSLVVPAAPIAPADLAAPAYNLVIRDISDEHDAQASLRRGVAVDHLTGLANRWAFFEAAEADWRRWLRASPPQPLTLLLFDVDRLSAVNAERGAAAGDAALRHVAEQLAIAFEPGAAPARLDRARFAVLLPHIAAAAAEAAAWRVCQAIADTPVQRGDGAAFAITASAGIATMSLDVTGIDDLLERADAALRDARARGASRVGDRSAVPAETCLTSADR